jgi:hypothetical protein
MELAGLFINAGLEPSDGPMSHRAVQKIQKGSIPRSSERRMKSYGDSGVSIFD